MWLTMPVRHFAVIRDRSKSVEEKDEEDEDDEVEESGGGGGRGEEITDQRH